MKMAETTGRNDGRKDTLESESSAWGMFLLSCLIEDQVQMSGGKLILEVFGSG